MKERAYPKQVEHEGDVELYGELKYKIDEAIFAAYVKAGTRKAKILVIASSDSVNTSKLLFGLKEQTQRDKAGTALWSAVSDVLESIGEIMDVMKEGQFKKITPLSQCLCYPRICASPGRVEVRVRDNSAPLRWNV